MSRLLEDKPCARCLHPEHEHDENGCKSCGCIEYMEPDEDDE